MASPPKLRRQLSEVGFRTPVSTPLRPPQSRSVAMSVLRSTARVFSIFSRNPTSQDDDEDFSLLSGGESLLESRAAPPARILDRGALIRAATHVAPVPFSTWQEHLRVLQEVKTQIQLKSASIKVEGLEGLIAFLDAILKSSFSVLGRSLLGISPLNFHLTDLQRLLGQVQRGEGLNFRHQVKTEESDSEEDVENCTCALCVVNQGHQNLSQLQQEQFETLHSVFSTIFYQQPPEEYEILVKVLHFVTQKKFQNTQYRLSKDEDALVQKALHILGEVESDAFVLGFQKALNEAIKKDVLHLQEGMVENFEQLQLGLEERFPNTGLFYRLRQFVEVEFVQLFSKTVEGCIAQHPNIELAGVYLILLEVQRGKISREKLQRVSDVLGRLDQFTTIAIELGEKNCLEALQKDIHEKLGEETIVPDPSQLSTAIQYLDAILRRNEGAWQSMQRDMRIFAQDMTRSAAQDVATIFEQKFQEELIEPPKELLEIQQVLRICSRLTPGFEFELSSQDQALFSRVAKDLGKKRNDAPNGEKETYGSMADFLRSRLSAGKITIPRDQLIALQRHVAFMDQKVQEHTGLAMQFGQKMGKLFEATVKGTAGDLTKAAPIGLLNIVRALRIAVHKKEFTAGDQLLIQLAKEEERNLESMQMDGILEKEVQAVLRLLDVREVHEDQKPRVQRLLTQLETHVLPKHQGVLTTAMQQISGQFAEQFIASLEDTGLLSTLKNVQDISERLAEMSRDIKGVTEDLRTVIDFIKTPLRVFMWSLIPLAFVSLIGGFWLTKIYIERKYPVTA
ncbi:MAG: hypothetical protein K940chlam8_00736 [Chlamydiae bacterium]|nr:hypothetical protein [Chlamydiota bacterium]